MLVQRKDLEIVETGLVLSRVITQGRVNGHAVVIHIGEDLLSASLQSWEELVVGGDSPAAAALLRVRLSVEPEDGLPAERVVCIGERLPVAEADDGVEDAAERLLGADVVDAAHEVGVGEQPAPQVVLAEDGDFAREPTEDDVEDVCVELHLVLEVVPHLQGPNNGS